MTYQQMNRHISKNAEDRRIGSAITAHFVFLTLQYLVLVSMQLEGTLAAERIQLISKLLVAMAYARALPIVWKRSKVRIIGTYFVWAFVFSLHYLVFPQNRMYQNELVFPFFFMCLPAFIYSSAVNDWTVLRDVMIKVGYIVFSIGALLAFLVFNGRVFIGSYSMSLGYYLLLPSIMFISEFWRTASFTYIMLFLISAFFILALGSRGPIMCIGLFVLLCLLRRPRNPRHHEIIAFLCVASSIVLAVLFFDKLLMGIQELLLRSGFRSRSIALFLSSKGQLGIRETIYRDVIAAIADHPILGIGIAGDRYIRGGSYVHNIFIEILANYGAVVGTLIVFGLLILVLRYFVCSTRQQYEMFAMWLCIGFIPLLVSGSYFSYMSFWIFIGLITKGWHIGGNLRYQSRKE